MFHIAMTRRPPLIRVIVRRFAHASRHTVLSVLVGTMAWFACSGVVAAEQTPTQPAQTNWAQAPAPFAWRATLEGGEQPGLYRVPVPMQVYETSNDPNLGDLRIYDARGMAMPYSWVPRDLDAGAAAQDMAVRVIALKGAARQDVAQRLSMTVKRAADDTIASISVDGASGRGQSEIGSIFDLSAITGIVHALVFEDYETDTQIHAFSLEASDDLSTWRTLRQEAHIVRLAQDGQVVQQNRVELAPVPVETARYLRLRWHDPASAPHLTKLAVRVSAAATAPRSLLWTEPQAPVEGQDRDFQFQAPAALPIERLRINLPKANLMAPVRVYAFDPAAQPGVDPWRLRAHAVLYRMQAEVGEIVSPDVLLPGEPMPRFRVILDARERLGGTPTVQIGFTPRSLIVAAQGQGPYTIAWGAPGMADGAIAMTDLAPNQSSAQLAATVDTLYAQRRESAEGMTVAVAVEPPAPPKPDFAAGEGWASVAFTVLLMLIDAVLAAMALRAYSRMRRAVPARERRAL